VLDHFAYPAAKVATVDRFLADLEDMSPSNAVIETGASARLRAASRQALAVLSEKFDDVAGRLREPGLSTLADELVSVVKLLVAEPILNRHLAEPSDNPSAKLALIDRLLADKLDEHTLELLRVAVSQRWSAEADLLAGIEHTARLALLKLAERNDEVDDVEDQLFRFGRVLDAQPRLTSLLSDYSAPADDRVALLATVLGDGANQTAKALLSQTVGLLRGERADEAVIDLAELAVARRGEIVAHVTAAADLTAAQHTRLTELLTRIYGQPVAVQLHVDPELLGGLSIVVGDEVIDGSIASRLAAAQSQLPD
jgi:F-type H+-transporting ATPase subunit delta